MNSQDIINIKIEDLVLWTENPRDPISPNSNDQDVANKAFEVCLENIEKEHLFIKHNFYATSSL